MTAATLAQAIDSTKAVLGAVNKEQLDLATPCASWKVSDLINHMIGAQYFFTAGVKGETPGGEAPDFSAGDFVAAFDEASSAALAAFSADGVMESMLSTPIGQMPGAAFVGLASTDTFVHGWDLAKATGQNTDLAPELAAGLLAGAKASIQDSFRGPEGAPFGAEQSAPAGASTADQLAAFLGRSI
jgi:uncharacterized protein (TIGR03086 family)